MTRALILAAGQGTRLRPLTNNKPKCLVPLQGRTLLERQVKTLKECGVEDIHIATGYCAEQIEALGFATTKNLAHASTNMVESLFAALSFIEKEGDLIIAYGDIVYNPENLRKLLASRDELSLMVDREWRRLWALRLENPLEDAETLMLDENGYVTELGKKPENYDRIQGQYTGLFKIRSNKIPAFVAFYRSLDRKKTYDGATFENMYMTSLLQLLIDSGWKVKAVNVDNGWLEIDSVEDLRLYETMADSGELDGFYKANP